MIMVPFKIVSTKPVWSGFVLLCEEPDGTYSVSHTDTHDCRTGRYWTTYQPTREAGQEEFETRQY